MYRLIKMSGLKTSSFQTVSTQFSSARQICIFCRHMGSVPPRNSIGDWKGLPEVGSRSHSTHINTALFNELKKRRKFRRHKQKYAELLEVYGNSSNETKASVKNLKPKHINLLANSPNVTLEHLHEIKQNVSMQQNKIPITSPAAVSTDVLSTSNKYSNPYDAKYIFEEFDEMHEDEAFKNIRVTDLTSFPVEDPELQKIILDEIVLDIKEEKDPPQVVQASSSVKDPHHTKKRENSLNKKTREELAKVKLSLLEKEGKEKSFNATLLAYLNLCESCGYLNRGMATLQHYLNRSLKGRHTRVSDVRIFQVLMQGYASRANINKVEELWKMMKTAELKPTPQAYASRIECLARKGFSDQNVKLKELSEMISNMEKDGVSMNDLFEKCIFIGNQRQVILDAINLVEPSFLPEITPPDLCYSCSLLQELDARQGGKSFLKSTVEGLVTRDQLQEFSQEQLNLELASTVKVKSIEKKSELNESVRFYRNKLEELQQIWIDAIDKGLQRDLNSMVLISSKKNKQLNIYPYLKVLEPHQYREIILQEVRKLAEGSETFSPTTYFLYSQLGHQVRTRFIVKYKKTHGIMGKMQQLYSEYLDWYMDPTKNNGRSMNARQEWQQLLQEKQDGPTVNIEEHMWPIPVLIGIGRFLYNIIIRDVKVDVNVLRENSKIHMLPAFYSLYRQLAHKNVEELKPHPVLSKLYRLSAQEDLVFDVSELPMVTPPVPWTSPTSGGNLLVKTNIIRLPSGAALQWERLKTAPPQQLYPSFDSLNQLSAVPWKVNQPILDIVIEVFNNGGNSKLEIPQPPSTCPLPQPVTSDMSKVERFEAYRQRMLLRRRKAEMYSLWCDALYRLSLGHHFRDRIFWLPHNMDFRGRVYPCPPHLNHLGSDMARSLLCFAKGESLGPFGLDWLKIHLVNLTGLKKRNSVKERLHYANEIMPDIVDSAENPLSGRMWWSTSEEPWQTLACCKEILSAMQHPEGPEKYICYFPVHQDGSCNGLQHYAALGRDEAGAFSVNLIPAEKPQDVYSCVAAIVERERAKDAANGVKTAIVLDGYVMRKVIKQTVMTTVYGVTRFGARLQIAKQLKDIDSFPKEAVWAASAYLVGKTFESIREMFTSTREIQDWFTECARLIAQICGQNVEYVTPLGLPVVQPYSRLLKKIDFHRNMDIGDTQETFSVDTYERPNVMKQKNAFPPNFIHSLDSSHMMLTSLHTEQKGIAFVSVHDCYWTHPSTVHIMNQICREQFVALHSEPILQDLSLFLQDKYGYSECDLKKDGTIAFQSKCKLNKLLRKVPHKGSLHLENVLDSIYFFS